MSKRVKNLIQSICILLFMCMPYLITALICGYYYNEFDTWFVVTLIIMILLGMIGLVLSIVFQDVKEE